ncbi:MAG TPA: membrane dipeptidase, partial [Bryobacteraceae bacterium]|nr:membrane dipeptidase [Bryobacteraceae bacterium]
MDLTRRDLLASCAKAGLLSAGAPFVARRELSLNGAPARTYSTRTIDLINDSLVVDMLGLLTLDWAKQKRWLEHPESFEATEWAKFKRSGITVFHPAIEYPCTEPRVFTKALFENWARFAQTNSRHFQTVFSACCLTAARKTGRVALVLGTQNSSHFEQISDVEFFYGLGQRVSQLTYNSRNNIGNGCTEYPDSGLTDFGSAVVSEMNRVGMAIDVSHAGDHTTL